MEKGTGKAWRRFSGHAVQQNNRLGSVDMTTAAPTHNRHLDATREAYLAAIARRPMIDAHDLAKVRQIVSNSTDWLREAYQLVANRPDIADAIERAGATLVALQNRLLDEARR